MVLGAVLFAGLAILGLGMLSYFADVDIVSVPDIGQYPAVFGMLAALGVFVAVLAPAARRRHPSFWSAAVVALAVALAHLVVVWLASLLVGADVASATAAVMQLMLGGATLVVALAAAAAAWIAIALRRTGARAPRWPWEREPDEDE